MLSPDRIRALLKLEPLPLEGGYFAETYQSGVRIAKAFLPEAYGSDRAAGTAIYYMLTPDTFSALHRLPGDEIFHFYLGDPVEMLQLHPDGRGDAIVLGHDLAAGMRPQHIVHGGVWQGSRLRSGGSCALLGATMSPGFDYKDYETGSREALAKLYPAHAARIASLTR
jgi:predicted cupin superfamily sugar epimerase